MHQNHDEKECYKWFPTTTDFTVSRGKWAVLVGINLANDDVDTTQVQVLDGRGVSIDVQIMARFDRDVTAAGATTTKVQVGLIRRMLVPPGGQITATAATNISLVECCSLENALSIL